MIHPPRYTCEYCGRQFYESRNTRESKPRFCCRECRIRSNDKHVICEHCGKDFIIRGSQHKKYCSKECRLAHGWTPKNPSKKSIFVCRWCGRFFEEWTYRNPTICSDQCRSEYGASKRAQQLYKGGSIKCRGMNWKSQSRKARRRDHFTCRRCGKNGPRENVRIAVHHIIPYREFHGDYEKANQLSNLISLCYSCHAIVESQIKQ
jgi:5-methylcytosine-specific restriction endonuclease McrA